MRYLILSDMHGNWEALEAVLDKARHQPFDVVLVLGDLVGYGAGPNQVVDALRELPGAVHMVRGNHDKVVAGIEDGANFNPAALAAACWTKESLTPENLRLVRELVPGPQEIETGLAICHGSPLDEDFYVFSDFDAFQIFSVHEVPVTFFGHTHIPSVFLQHGGEIEVALLRDAGTLEIEEGASYLLNPGSIGQPRDRDPRAAYMTYDSDKRLVRWYRVGYPVGKAQQRILEAGLPPVLADRLAVGV